MGSFMAEKFTTPSTRSLCDECKKLNIENISSEEGFPLHSTLLQLQACANTCTLCKIAYHSSLECLQIAPGSEHRWNNETRFPRLQAIARRADRFGDPGTDIHVRGYNRRSPKDESSGSQFVRIATDEKDPATKHGVNFLRSLPQDTSSKATLTLAKKWIEDCVSGNCGGQSREAPPSTGDQPTDKPTRLIKLQTDGLDGLKLVDGEPIKAPYAALTYTWGRYTPTWRTTTANVEGRKDSIRSSDLPQTIRDAIEVTRRLDLSYIWIDSICIVQDDSEDWSREAARMAGVYMNAYVTIAATASTDSKAGMFNECSISWLDTVHHFRTTNTLSDGTVSVLYMWQAGPGHLWEPEVLGGYLMTRGWCCQERLLSPRTLHFARPHLFWECRHGIRSEDNELNRLQSRGISDILESISHKQVSGQSARNHQDPALSSSAPSVVRLLKLWYSRVVAGDYSQRNLTNGSDKLIALAGLANAFYAARPMEYLAGLWDQDLLCGLCWSRRGSGNKTSEYRAPSWSWASQDSTIFYHTSLISSRPKEYAEVVGVDVKLGSPNPFGTVSGGNLTLKAPMMEGYVYDAILSCQFDDGSTTGDNEHFNEVILDNGVVVGAVMDDECFTPQRVTVCLLAQDTFNPKQGDVFLLLLQAVEYGSTHYRRVGLARQTFGLVTNDGNADVVNKLKASKMEQFSIV